MSLKKDIFGTPEGKQDFIIALIVISLFAIFIYQFSFSSTEEVTVQNPKNASSAQVEAQPNIQDEEQHYVYTSSSTTAATTIQVVDGYERGKQTAVVISDIKKSTPVAVDQVSEPVHNNNEIILLYEAQKRRADSIASAEPKEDIKEAVVPVEEEVLNETTPTAAPTEATKVAITTANKSLNCVVIIGVFKEDSNRAAIIEKLKSLGHVHAEGILREGLNYVGVPVNCENNQDRKKLLSDLNQAFGIDSWVKKL